jgi:hypothetical protein
MAYVNSIHDLKNLEKKAFRATHQDGLWDIYMGGVVMSMAILAYSEASKAFPLVRFSIFLLGLGAAYLIFWAGKKYITTPRLGQVKFGPQRQRRKRILVMVMSGMVFVQVVILIGTILLWRNPSWASSLGFGQTNPDLERLIVAVIGAMFVGPSIALIAYFNDFLRGYYIAFIVSLGVFSLIWFGEPLYLISAGLLIMIPGVVLFIRFLSEHPRPPAEVTHG